jgi:NADPH2:quinone reductase
MKALLSHQPGGPETLVLEEIADPTAGPGEVRVNMRAIGVNFPDLLIIQSSGCFGENSPDASPNSIRPMSPH